MSTATRQSLWRIPQMRTLVYLSLLGFTGFFLLLSALPMYAAANGTPEGFAGLVTTVMLASTVVLQLLVPAGIRKFGQPAVLAFGLIALGAPSPLLLLHDELWWLLLLSVVRGWGFAVLTVLMPILATQICPPERHGEAIGLYGLAIAAPNLIGIPLSVALTTAGHFTLVAFLAAAPVLAVPFARRFPDPHAPVLRARAAAPATSAFPWIMVLAVSVVLITVTGVGGGFTILPVQLPTGNLAALTLLVFGITGALFRWQIGRVADRHGIRTPLLLCLITGAAGVAALAVGVPGGPLGGQAAGDVLVLLGGAAFGVCYGGVQNLTLLLTFELAGPQHRNRASAVWNATYDAGTAIGALALGAAAAGFGLAATMFASAALLGAMLILALRVTRSRRELTK